KGYVKKSKNLDDERNITITLTNKGELLKDEALCVPHSIASEFDLTAEEATALYNTLYKILDREKSHAN
ncbi:MAG: MarR family transcriptional regulator, partial [Clostridia bacterium]|nr:MarR family transcriptional regulator [Clostridia bacterium]